MKKLSKIFGSLRENRYLCNENRRDMKFRVTRPVIVTTTDIWEAESEQDIWNRLNNGPSLASEIDQLGLSQPGRTIKYEFLDDKVEKL